MGIKRYSDFVNVNEKVEQYDFEFHTVVVAKNIDFDNEPVDNSKEQYIEKGDLTIHWIMDFDNRKYGINSMAPVIKKISGFYTLVTPQEQGRDIEDEVEILMDEKSDWKFENDFQSEFKFGYSIVPGSIEIDFKDKTIKILYY